MLIYQHRIRRSMFNQNFTSNKERQDQWTRVFLNDKILRLVWGTVS